MVENSNTLNGVVVNRQQHQTTVSDNPYEEYPEGLPFYYTMDMKLCIVLIILGVLAGIIQILLTGFFLFLPVMRKEYRCIRCKTKYTKVFRPKQCPLCGGTIIPESDYVKIQLAQENKLV